jgi:hypothetical protein
MKILILTNEEAETIEIALRCELSSECENWIRFNRGGRLIRFSEATKELADKLFGVKI